MSAAEWNRTPWWEQNILREGLEAEAPWIGRALMMSKATDPLDITTGLFANTFDPEREETEGTAEDLSSFGIQVRKSGKMTPVYQSAAVD